MKSLVLTEKPSVGREIARVLGCHTKGKGYLEGPKHVVTWALGHLVTLAEPEDYDKKYKTWRLEDLPMMPRQMKLKAIKQTSQQYGAVKNLMKRGDLGELIIATDAGREGELVARWIMEYAGWKKPFRRLWISSQTDSAIKEGFARLQPGKAYDNLYASAVCRAEADWLIGLNVTRALTTRFNAQLSAGRVQTPTLAMMVNREAEIKKFIPKDYWTVRADFGDYFGDWRDTSGQGRIFDFRRAEGLLEKTKGAAGKITDLKVEQKADPPPLLYDLTELQRDANRRYGFSAQKTLSVLQGLYERHKLVTYPRTDSRYLTKDIIPTLKDRLNSVTIGEYAEYTRPLTGKPLPVNKRIVDDSRVSDHHAIIPTEEPVRLSVLEADERKLYDLIVKKFIAAFYPPFKYERVTVITTAAGESFYSRGKVVRDQGWKAVYGRGADQEGEERDDALPEQVLHSQKKGAVKQVKDCKANKSQTKPPARYTEATLLSAMESPGKFIDDEELREALKQSGLGTPATRAEIIEKLINTDYVERRGKELVPTSKGIQLIGLVSEELRSPELTAKWEQSLSEMARGRQSKAVFMTGIREYTVKLVKEVATSGAQFKADNISRVKCPDCGQYLIMIKGKKGKSLVCPDRSCGHREAAEPQVSNFRCPDCKKKMVILDKQGSKMVRCKNCGFTEKMADFKENLSAARGKGAVNKKLINQYSDQGTIGTNLGALLKEAMESKE
ncbi:DNA topoisomerase III [Phosphitispora fastidiosa]|uniref:DNA topoisomerase III n=1 Tax=Phosphitispora fastidiosa TaxID=2837202 RepID=UPI001E54720F|nr:DNA topoisomerase III [Phosphitispora fastidiosa]MBU7006144.1 DNA topoisomerase-3 [Phosphitispora fastidiosa]